MHRIAVRRRNQTVIENTEKERLVIMNISQTFVFFSFSGSSSICNLLNSVNRYCGSVLSDNNFATGDNLPVCGKLQICMMHAS